MTLEEANKQLHQALNAGDAALAREAIAAGADINVEIARVLSRAAKQQGRANRVTTTVDAAIDGEPVDQLPFDAYVFLEDKLSTLREIVVKEATRRAHERAGPSSDSAVPVPVSRKEVRQAFETIMGDPDRLRAALQTDHSARVTKNRKDKGPPQVGG